MAKTLFALVLGAVCLLAAVSAMADWVPSDGHKMHFPQYPNEWGWDVYCSDGMVLADDWTCGGDGEVLDLHFWGSWKDDIVGTIEYFEITFYENITADQSGLGYSIPGTVVWGPVRIYHENVTVLPISYVPEPWEGWMDPWTGDNIQNNHNDFYQYNIVDIDQIPGIPDPFYQYEGEIYWISITAQVEPDPAPAYWGWKSSYLQHEDDAVFLSSDGTGWYELTEPGLTNMDIFTVTVGPDGTVDASVSGGDFSYNDEWYYYTDEGVENAWWNIWFYDHPFNIDRWKEVWVNGFASILPGATDSWIEIAVNWSTPQWSTSGLQPGEPRRPPLPDDLPAPVGTYLERYRLTQGPQTIPLEGIGFEDLGYTIFEYGNPEWISIDVRGQNFIFNGEISHACIGTEAEPASMDLAFVITGAGDELGACCYGDPVLCANTTQADCESAAYNGDWYAGEDCATFTCPGADETGACCDGQNQCFVTTKVVCEAIAGNIYMGDNVPCLGDGNGNGQDDRCEMGLPQGACCVPSDGTCYMTDAATCAANGDDYVGDGTACLGDLNNNGMDDACEPPPGACCLPDGQCIMTTAADCMSAVNKGDYLGDGTACLGDHDDPPNGVDDACEGSDAKLKWFQEPDLSQGGMDVSAFRHPTYGPYLLAADFPCTETGPITEIHVFGSWYLDKLPFNDPKNVSFTLSIHTDIPADEPGGPGYSMPGEVICLEQDVPFDVRMFAYDLEEGWLEPPDYWTPYPHGDAVCWEYIFYPTWECLQEGTPDVPLVYWLDVQATALEDPDAYFGWKTSVPPEWNDDAVWANDVDDWDHAIQWQELLYPPGHPYYGIYESIDLAFAIYGEEGDPIGACCWPNGTCTIVTQADCETNPAAPGVYLGDGTVCAGDNDGDGIDDACGATVIRGACCLQDGSCIVAQAAFCASAGGSYLGDNTVCLGDADYNGVDDACETPVKKGACCWPGGSCSVTTAANCVQNGGSYLGDNTACLGDADGNSVDDACETPDPDFKWEQEPDIEPTGFDVNATFTEAQPFILADDFECTVTGPITRIHVYGSWLADFLPPGGPTDVNFVLSIHEDIPADPGDPLSYSRPGGLLCLLPNLPFEVQPYATDLEEGWFDPPDKLHSVGDQVCWEYIFYLPPDLCIQEGSQDPPIVYWLDVQAYPNSYPPPSQLPLFGWKSSLQHWNDDATWAFGQDDPTAPLDWQELIYSADHPMAGESVDLAFKIIGSSGVPTPTGACCWPDGTCTIATQADCENSPFGVNGTYQGDFTPCLGDQNGNGVDDACENASLSGACCFIDPASGPMCINTTHAYCLGLPSGAWYVGQNCNDPDFSCPNQAPMGACCYEDAAGNMNCVNTTQGDCFEAYGGTWYLGQDCATWNCPTPQPMGACCYGDPASPSCVNTTEDKCKKIYNGAWYSGQDCASFDCPTIVESGACCFEDAVAGTSCVNTTQADCLTAYGGTWYAGQDCASFDCPDQPPTGACCYGDPTNPSCANTTHAECLAAYGGTWYAGQDCASFVCPIPQETGACCYLDSDGNEACVGSTQLECNAIYGGTWYAGEYCFGGSFSCPDPEPLGACCYGDVDPQLCATTTEDQCLTAYGGTWYAGEDCATFTCPTVTTGACCLTDGCLVVNPAMCAMVLGTYMGNGTTCDDADLNGIADICETPEELKWRQPPDLTELGLDVMVTNDLVLADDFRCDEPGRITKVVVYGSWYHDQIPDHEAVSFTLSFHRDIPAVEPDIFSRPGELICLREFTFGSYQFEPVLPPGQITEGWYDPRSPDYEVIGDHNIYKYTFEITDPCWTQTGRNGEPKVYWLNVQARVPSVTEAYFGWKTSSEHWNDDATWAIGVDPDISPWQELRYPPEHPMAPASIDLAFEIHGVAEDCCLIRVGDANGYGDYPDEVTLGDIMLLVDVKFISQDCSKVPCLTEADVNQDGGANPSCEDHVTLGDIMMLVDFLFITGPELGHLNDCL